MEKGHMDIVFPSFFDTGMAIDEVDHLVQGHPHFTFTLVGTETIQRELGDTYPGFHNSGSAGFEVTRTDKSFAERLTAFMRIRHHGYDSQMGKLLIVYRCLTIQQLPPMHLSQIRPLTPSWVALRFSSRASMRQHSTPPSKRAS